MNTDSFHGYVWIPNHRIKKKESVRGGNYGHNSHHNDRRGGRQNVPDRSRVDGSGGGYQDMSFRQQSVSKGGDKPVPADDKSRDAKTIQGSSQQLDDSRNGSSTEKWVSYLPSYET